MASTSDKGLEQFDDSQLVEVAKDFFFDGMVLPVAVYLRMKPGSYLVIGKKGDKASLQELHAFNHTQSKLFVKTIDYPILISFITQFTTKVVAQKSVPDQVKAKYISGLTSDAVHTLEKSGFTSVDKIQKVGAILVQLADSVEQFNEVLKILETLPNNESKHSMTTCMVSLMIAEEMKLTQQVVLEKIAMGALLHDVGLKFVPQSILDKPRHLWSPEELNTYEQHPLKGAEMLRDIKDIPMDVLLIVSEHHENAGGTGFPKKLRDVKMSPLARIIGVADYFADLLFNQKDGKNYSPDEAITYIEDLQGQPFNKQVFLALKNIINKKALSDKKVG